MTTIRPLQLEDEIQFLQLLSQFRPSDGIKHADFQECCENMRVFNTHPYVMVENQSQQIIALGTLHIEQKFIHNLGKVGHLEDLVVDRNHRRQKHGLAMFRHLTEEASRLGCYKVILNCDPTLEDYYSKAGFSKSQIQMSRYLE
jgi:glucosamine-phosphate N-acetyltransferase